MIKKEKRKKSKKNTRPCKESFSDIVRETARNCDIEMLNKMELETQTDRILITKFFALLNNELCVESLKKKRYTISQFRKSLATLYDLNQPISGELPLCVAAAFQSDDILLEILKLNPTIDAIAPSTNFNALTEAILSNSIKCVATLIQFGANPWYKLPHYNSSPVEIAVLRDEFAIIEQLIYQMRPTKEDVVYLLSLTKDDSHAAMVLMQYLDVRKGLVA